jgi:hypothetical protein
MANDPTLDELRRYAIGRSLFAPTTLAKAIDGLGFVQADPIRAPARAQDLILRHRARDYRAGDLERRYPRLPVEEDFFVNYGFLPRTVHALMHPRSFAGALSATQRKHAAAVLDYLRERGPTHPRRIEEQFARGKVTNYWGGISNATTHLLDVMHYRGMLRVARRAGGVRIYAAHAHAAHAGAVERSLDALVDVVVQTYAPLPARSLAELVRRLRVAAPQWRKHLPAALKRAQARLSRTCIAGVDWYWPAAEDPRAHGATSGPRVRLLTPFDPVVWDRRRFELLWGWAYRFEAYLPAPKRKLGYYALPLLWDDRVIGWANLRVDGEELATEFGYVAGRAPRDGAFRRELDDELARMRAFLSLER